ncbi:integrase [Spirochaetia bacterium]|nr:integrase [Spirochaetia bacterium]
MRRVGMEKAREILRLNDAGMTQREIACATGCSLGNVNAILVRAREAGIVDLKTVRNKELSTILYPPVKEAGTKREEPDLNWVRREMQRPGVTLTLLWEEYKTAHPNGYMLSQFCERYRKFCKQNDVYMHKTYKAGERMLVDWAGLTLQYTNTNGEIVKVYYFVAVLPASSYLYVEPFLNMGQESWITAHGNAFEYYGGVPAIIVPDNTKTAVIKAKYYDPELNKTYHDMAQYYGAAIIPTRSRAPRDKAPVENSVLIVERRIIAKLRDRQFHSFPEVWKAVQEELEILNTQPFAKLSGNRRETFRELEQGQLRKLPPSRYEYAEHKLAKVGFDYHVHFDSHYYSVPYTNVGKQVTVRATSRTIEILADGERLAGHLRNYDKYSRYTTDDEHMPEKHKAVADWTPERLRKWAAKTGARTEAYIVWLMEQREHPEQAFKTCAGILRMGGQGTKEHMEQVCEQAMANNIYTYKYFERLFKRSDLSVDGQEKCNPITHENIRGQEYYSLAEEALHA